MRPLVPYRPMQTPPAKDPKPRSDDREIDLPEPAWYLSSWELRSGLTVIEHDCVDTVPGGLIG